MTATILRLSSIHWIPKMATSDLERSRSRLLINIPIRDVVERLGGFRRVKGYLDTGVSSMMSNTLITPLFDYCKGPSINVNSFTSVQTIHFWGVGGGGL